MSYWHVENSQEGRKYLQGVYLVWDVSELAESLELCRWALFWVVLKEQH